MGNALKYWRPKYQHGKLNADENRGRPKETPLVEPLAKEPKSEESPQQLGYFMLPPELNPSRWNSFKRESSGMMKRFFKWLFWKDTYRVENVTEPVQIGTHPCMKFMPLDSSGGEMIPSSEPVYQDRVISSTRIPVTRLRLPFRLAGIALLTGTLGWGAGYCMGFPPPQRLLIESQRNELYRNMELEECWSTNLSQDTVLRDLQVDMNRVRCAERKYSEAHGN